MAAFGSGIVPPGARTVVIRTPRPAHPASSYAKHDRADFAQEFLRRGSAYRAIWARSQDRGEPDDIAEVLRRYGLVRLFDPELGARLAPAIWRSDTASQIVTLAPPPAGFDGASVLPDTVFAADIEAHGHRHVVADCGAVRHRFLISSSDPFARLVILLAPLGDTLHAAACDAARRAIGGLRMSETASVLRPSPLQQQRLALLLRVLDAAHAGASNREIGARIVYPWLVGTDAAAWKSMSERRRVQRLIAEAHALADGGYRRLLKA